MRIYQEITELIGGTPLMKLGHYGEKHQLTATLMAKLEYLNPAGSVGPRGSGHAVRRPGAGRAAARRGHH